MQLQRTVLFLLGLISFAHALALPTALESWAESTKDLFRRKGGGSGGGRGGGGGGGGSSSGSRTSSTSSSGGSTKAGSGPPRSYGGGGYYGGGASVPYRAGDKRGTVTPFLLGGAALAFFPGIWLYSVYVYSWPGNYTWRNNTSNRDESGPVNCLCEQYSECGCDMNNNTDFLNAVANQRNITYRTDNGTLYVNGSLPNGTTAPGGEDAATSLKYGIIENSGYWVVIAGVTYAVSFL